MKKKLISLDADGTLWYPKSTKRSKAPHWIYDGAPLPEEYLEELILIPDTVSVLDALSKAGFRLVVLSTNPHPIERATSEMKKKMDHFNLGHYFDTVMTSPNYPEGKGEVLSAYIEKNDLAKEDVIHVGDSYNYDYHSVTSVGVDAILIETEYTKFPEDGTRPDNLIQGLDELPGLLSIAK